MTNFGAQARPPNLEGGWGKVHLNSSPLSEPGLLVSLSVHRGCTDHCSLGETSTASSPGGHLLGLLWLVEPLEGSVCPGLAVAQGEACDPEFRAVSGEAVLTCER